MLKKNYLNLLIIIALIIFLFKETFAWLTDFNQEKYLKLVNDYWLNNDFNQKNYLETMIEWAKWDNLFLWIPSDENIKWLTEISEILLCLAFNSSNVNKSGWEALKVSGGFPRPKKKYLEIWNLM